MAAREGSRVAFEAIYTCERGVVYAFLVRLTQDPNVAGDLFQNVWLKLAIHARRLQPDTNLRAWLLTVARNEVRSHQRALRWDLSRLLAWRRELATGGLPQPTAGRLIDLDAALGRLNAADREVLLLEAVEDLTAEQAAAVLGLSQGAWRKRLSRARQRLSAQLDPESPHVTQPLGANLDP